MPRVRLLLGCGIAVVADVAEGRAVVVVDSAEVELLKSLGQRSWVDIDSVMLQPLHSNDHLTLSLPTF